MEEIGVSAVSISIFTYHLLIPDFLIILISPCIIIIRRFGFLQLVKKDLVFVDYPGETFDSVGSV